jgi:hypothetical protein
MGRWVALIPLLGLAASVDAASADFDAWGWRSTGPFKMSPAKNRCIAATTFKRKGDSLLVALEARPAGTGYEMRLYAPGNLRRWDNGKFSLGTAKLESDRVDVRSGPASTIIYRMGVNRAELGAAGPNPDLKMREISNPGEITISGLGAAVPLVDACTADLLAHWGYSKEAQRAVVTAAKAKKDWASYVSSQDYPILAIHARAGGETHALIDVGADGIGSNCRIIQSSGSNELDKMSCKIVTERASYDPALNSKGEPVRSPNYLVFRWEIPGRW